MKAHGLYATAGNKATPVTMKLLSGMQDLIKAGQFAPLTLRIGLNNIALQQKSFLRLTLDGVGKSGTYGPVLQIFHARRFAKGLNIVRRNVCISL